MNLTKAGQKAYQQTIAGTIVYTRDFLSALDAAEQRRLHGLLQKASRSLGFGWQ